jgi:hypothetical protein
MEIYINQKQLTKVKANWIRRANCSYMVYNAKRVKLKKEK